MARIGGGVSSFSLPLTNWVDGLPVLITSAIIPPAALAAMGNDCLDVAVTEAGNTTTELSRVIVLDKTHAQGPEIWVRPPDGATALDIYYGGDPLANHTDVFNTPAYPAEYATSMSINGGPQILDLSGNGNLATANSAAETPGPFGVARVTTGVTTSFVNLASDVTLPSGDWSITRLVRVDAWANAQWVAAYWNNRWGMLLRSPTAVAGNASQLVVYRDNVTRFTVPGTEHFGDEILGQWMTFTAINDSVAGEMHICVNGVDIPLDPTADGDLVGDMLLRRFGKGFDNFFTGAHAYGIDRTYALSMAACSAEAAMLADPSSVFAAPPAVDAVVPTPVDWSGSAAEQLSNHTTDAVVATPVVWSGSADELLKNYIIDIVAATPVVWSGSADESAAGHATDAVVATPVVWSGSADEQLSDHATDSVAATPVVWSGSATEQLTGHATDAVAATPVNWSGSANESSAGHATDTVVSTPVNWSGSADEQLSNHLTDPVIVTGVDWSGAPTESLSGHMIDTIVPGSVLWAGEATENAPSHAVDAVTATPVNWSGSLTEFSPSIGGALADIEGRGFYITDA